MSSRIKTWGLIILLLIVGATYALQISVAKGIFLYTDYGKFYQSLHFTLQGKSAYTPISFTIKEKPGDTKKPERTPSGPNLNPPLFVLLFLPLGLVSYATSLWIWLTISTLCGILSVHLLLKALNVARPSLTITLGLTFALFVYFPTFANITLGQVGLVLLPLIIGSWLAARRKKLAALGILLGIATSLKIFFGLFALYFLLRREWRALFYFCLTIIILNLVTFALLGKITFIDYYHTFHFIKWYSASWNASFLGFFARLFGDNELNRPLLPIAGLAIKLYALCSALLIMGLIKFLWPTPTIEARKKTDLDFSIILVAALLLSPLGWLYYFPFLIIPFMVLFELAREGYYPIALRVTTALTIFLTSLPFYLKPPILISNYIAVLNWSGCYFYSLISLCVTLFFVRSMLQQRHKPIPDHCPSYLATLLYTIALLPSLLGIIGATHGLLLYTTDYTPKFDKIYFGSSLTPNMIVK